MTIGRKMALGFGVALGFLAVIGAVAYRNTNRLTAGNGEVERAYAMIQEIEGVFTHLKDAETGQRGFLLVDDETYLAPYLSAIRDIDGAVRSLQVLTTGRPDQRRRLAVLERLIAEKMGELKRTIELRRGSGREAALALVKTGQGKAAMDEIRAVIREMRTDEEQQLAARTRESLETARSTQASIILGTAAALIATFLSGLLITRGITGPVGALVEGAGRIGRGELDTSIAVTSRDEVGTLAQAINNMAADLRVTMVSADTEKRSRGRVETLLETIREAVTRLTSSGTEILASTAEQASGAREQAAAVAQTVATVDEVTQTAAQAAQRARTVGESVQRNLETGRAGRDAIESSIAALERLRARVEATAGQIIALAEQAQAIGEIIATVNDIADQTNILALNAAIEASRAGEHGRGFAVVAGEVKALADQSKRATQQVRQILGEIQRATHGAVLSTEEVTKGVAAAAEAGAQAGRTISALTETLTEAAQSSSQIVASAGQQATGMAQISQAMKNLDQVARQNLVATRQVEQAAMHLNALGSQLAGLTSDIEHATPSADSRAQWAGR